MINPKHYQKYHAARNIPLNYEEAYELGKFALYGCGVPCTDEDINDNQKRRRAQFQSIALLTALHNQALYSWEKNKLDESVHDHRLPNNAAEQIAGICAAVFKHDIGTSEFGFVNLDVDVAMDNCGMGGDIIPTANLSTLAGFIASSAGIPMCKHGSPSNADKGKYGSSDFISIICGIDNFCGADAVKKSVEKHGFGYTEAIDTRFKRIHMQTHAIAMMPHMNDIIGPITNPLDPRKLRRRVIGVNHLIPPRIIAQVYQILNSKGITHMEHALVLRGFAYEDHRGGMDEISICPGGTQVVELKQGKINEFTLSAENFGVSVIKPEEAIPVGDKGKYSLGILKREVGGNRANMAIANAAPLFYLAGHSTDWKKCFQEAAKMLKSGAPYEKMLSVKRDLPL